jgi:teichoic acid transport system permease protein
MKKRLVVTFIVFIFLAAVFCILNPRADKNVVISMTAESGHNDIFQFFYANEDDYTEAQSLKQDIPGKLELEIDRHNVYVRFDFGDTVNTINISDLYCSVGGAKTPIDLNAFVKANEVEITGSQEYGYTVVTSGDDPNAVYQLAETYDELRRECRKNNIVWYLLISFLISLLVFWKFDIVKESLICMRDIIGNRSLIVKLAINDFKSRFAGSYMGITWAFIQPVVTVVIYVFVFQFGLKAQVANGMSFVLWLIAGIIPWFFFQDAVVQATNSLLEYAYLVKKVVFKIDILPMVKIINAAIIHVVFILLGLLLYGKSINIYIIQVVYYSLATMCLALGISYITSSVMVFFRDLGQIVNILLQFGIWLTPIMWDIESNFGPVIKKIERFNPVFYLVDGYRDAFYNKTWFWQKPVETIYFWLLTGLIFVAGMHIFKKLEKHFADVL